MVSNPFPWSIKHSSSGSVPDPSPTNPSIIIPRTLPVNIDPLLPSRGGGFQMPPAALLPQPVPIHPDPRTILPNLPPVRYPTPTFPAPTPGPGEGGDIRIPRTSRYPGGPWIGVWNPFDRLPRFPFIGAEGSAPTVNTPALTAQCAEIMSGIHRSLLASYGSLLRSQQAMIGLLTSLVGMRSSCPMGADCGKKLEEMIRRLSGALDQVRDWVAQVENRMQEVTDRTADCYGPFAYQPWTRFMGSPGGVGGLGRPSWTDQCGEWANSAANTLGLWGEAVAEFQRSCKCAPGLVPVRPVYNNV